MFYLLAYLSEKQANDFDGRMNEEERYIIPLSVIRAVNEIWFDYVLKRSSRHRIYEEIQMFQCW